MPARLRRAFLECLIVLLLWPAACRAADIGHDVRLGAGEDVLHKHGMGMAAFTVDGASFLAWNDGNFGAGLGWRAGSRVGWNGSAGLIIVREVDDDVGTHVNFLFRASYCGRSLCLSYAHISHGALLGIAPRATNSGLNFVFLEYRLR